MKTWVFAVLPACYTLGPASLGFGVLFAITWMIFFGTVLLIGGLVVSAVLINKQEERIAALEEALHQRP